MEKKCVFTLTKSLKMRKKYQDLKIHLYLRDYFEKSIWSNLACLGFVSFFAPSLNMLISSWKCPQV